MQATQPRTHRFHALIAVALMLCSIGAPRMALGFASGEGLLLQTLGASEARERSQQEPSQRDREDDALKYALLADAMPFTAVQMRSQLLASRDSSSAPMQRITASLVCGPTDEAAGVECARDGPVATSLAWRPPIVALPDFSKLRSAAEYRSCAVKFLSVPGAGSRAPPL